MITLAKRKVEFNVKGNYVVLLKWLVSKLMEKKFP